MKKTKKLTLLLVLLLVLLSLISCQTEEPEEQEPQTPPAGDEEDMPITDPDENEAEGAFEDGEYTAEGEADERGWTPMIAITVTDGEISEVVYDEENEEGQMKSEDEDYNTRWEESAGISAPEAYEALTASLIETQDPENVETVSGATSAYESFVSLAKEALDK